MITSGEVSEPALVAQKTPSPKDRGDGQREPHNRTHRENVFSSFLATSRTASLQEEKGAKKKKTKPEPFLQLSNWGPGEDGKGAFSGERKASPRSSSEENGEGGVGAVLGQSGSVLVPARNDGNSVY